MSAINPATGENGSVRLVLKLVVIFFVVLFMMIPISMIGKIGEERKERAVETENEIVGMSGGRPEIAGPVLIVPVRITERDSDGHLVETRAHVAVLAKEMSITGEFRSEVRTRGIYHVPLISGPVRIEAEFSDVASLVDEALSGLQYQADFVLAWYELDFADRRSIKSTPVITAGGKDSAMKLGDATLKDSGGSVRSQVVDAATGGKVSVTLELGGGGTLSVYPLAQSVRCDVSSDWKSPSFSGYSLPATREVGDAGFKASWYIGESASPYPRSFIAERTGENLSASTFGVDFFQPISVYHKTERALKYALLFIVIPFVVFFLFELFAHLRIHPLQYALIGIADVLFYLVLLSLSEHLPFLAAYSGGAIAVCALVSFYSSAILKGAKRALAMAAVLGGVYLYLYVALESEDYALLVGTVGVFAIVAFVMIITRNVDWYSLPGKDAAPGSEAESPDA